VFDRRTRRDGEAIEYLGYYNQHAEKAADKLTIDKERALYWLSKGARPTDTIAALLKKSGIVQ
jgi:small subunit ribosomal protein S16